MILLMQNYASLGLSASLDKNKEKFDPEVTYTEPGKNYYKS